MSDTHNHVSKPEAEAVAEIVKRASLPFMLDVEHPDGTKGPILFRPLGDGGFAAEEVGDLLESYRDRPRFREGTATLEDLQSFIAHVKRFQDVDSVVFARKAGQPSLTCVLDYHPAGATPPRFGHHRSHYAFPLSTEWLAWTAMTGKPMTVPEFSAFIEDRLADVADPSAALTTAKDFAKLFDCHFASPGRLLELARGLSVNVEAKVTNHANLSSGESTISFATSHLDDKGQQLKIPGAFLLQIPVFRGGAHYQVPARLRYRVRESRVTWFYDLHRVAEFLEHAVGEAIDIVKAETGLPVLAGSPE